MVSYVNTDFRQNHYSSHLRKVKKNRITYLKREEEEEEEGRKGRVKAKPSEKDKKWMLCLPKECYKLLFSILVLLSGMTGFSRDEEAT